MGAPSEPRVLGLERPQTPNRLWWLTDDKVGVNQALEILGQLSNIEFPLRGDQQSPAKRTKSPTHEIKWRFSQLFFTNRNALKQRIETFVDYLDAHVWKDQHDAKVEFLQSTLSAENETIVELLRSTRSNRIISPAQMQEPNVPSAQSPTSFDNHLPHPNTKDIEEIQLPTKITSNTASANTLFWSEVQRGSQDPATPATTIDDSFTQDYGSSWNESDVSTFRGKLVAAGISTAKLGSNFMQLDGANDIDSTQETKWGASSPLYALVQMGTQSQQKDSTAPTTSSTGPPGQLSEPAQSQQSAVAAIPVSQNQHADTALNRDLQLKVPKRSAEVTKTELSLIAADPGAQTKWDEITPKKRRHDEPSRQVADATDASPSPAAKKGEHARVRNIVRDGLTDIRLPTSILNLDLELRSAFHMVAQGGKLTPKELAQRWNEPRNLDSLNEIAQGCDTGSSKLAGFSYSNCSLRANIRISDSSKGRLLMFEHVHPQEDLPNLLEKMFGYHRFLTVDVETLNAPRSLGLAGQTEFLKSRFLDMISEVQEFLGCKWHQFYAKGRDRRKAGEKPVKAGSMQYVFFAISGPGLDPITLYTIMDRVLHFSMNKSMSLCKLYARLDLPMSRTRFIHMYSTEVAYTSDTHGTGEPEDTQFDDPKFGPSAKSGGKPVMNDGCCEADELVFQWIREEFRLNVVPSGAQIRCAGAKGMMYLRRPDRYGQSSRVQGFSSRATTAAQSRPLIHLTDSMRKVKLPSEVFHSTSPDLNLLALRVVSVALPPKQSSLHFDYIQILLDRGVPTETIERLAKAPIEQEMQDFVKVVSSITQLRYWLHSKYPRQRGREIETVGRFPVEHAERAKQMLDAGFEPAKSNALAGVLQSVATLFFNERRKAYKIPLERSTMAFGVADCGRFLKPGQIQFNSSQGIIDPRTGSRMHHLLGPVLLSRLPAARPSDIRKVVAVYRPELSHIKDQVIFPTTGSRPLADQCSGGDYDGDQFWVCWEALLVEPFLNAPTPVSLPDPKSMGITVDNRPTHEVVSQPSEEQARLFARMGTQHRMRGSAGMLGKVTNLLAAQAHADNSLATARAKALADLKDTIIDSDKNGYVFTNADFAKFKKDHGIANLPKPAYTKVTKTNEDDGDDSCSTQEFASVNPGNILDRLHLIELPRLLDKALKEVKAKLERAPLYDESLSMEYEARLRDAKDPEVYKELYDLKSKLDVVKEEWNMQCDLYDQAKALKRPVAWKNIVAHCRSVFEGIEPDNKDHPVLREWIRPCGGRPTIWEMIKASALAKFHYNGKMWTIAGNEICWLKADRMGIERPMLSSEMVEYKARRPGRAELEMQSAESNEPEPWEDDDTDAWWDDDHISL